MNTPRPTELNLHRISRVLEIRLMTAPITNLPAEYLRVYSLSAEVAQYGPGQRKVPALGKEGVKHRPHRAGLQLCRGAAIDDEHNTGIYAWETLYQSGQTLRRPVGAISRRS